jgi:flagellar basal body rod protein FlgG
MSAYAGDYRKGVTSDMSRAGGMHVNSAGKVYDKDGNEIDPRTGNPIEV